MEPSPDSSAKHDFSAAFILKRLSIYVASAYAIVCAGFFVFQDKFIFFPKSGFAQTPENERWTFEEVELDVAGETTHGWLVPAESGRRGVILFSHGNAENIGDQIETIRPFRQLGFDTLVYDYAGYGLSTGEPTEQRVYDDVRAMYRYLIERKGYAPGEIVLYGRSVGGGPTAQLATEVVCAAVVLESTFRSVAAVAAEIMPWIPRGPLVRYRFDNESKVRTLTVPVLIVHSPEDSIIPFAHGRALFDAANEPKQFIETGGDHLEGHWITFETYIRGLGAFFDGVFNPISGTGAEAAGRE